MELDESTDFTRQLQGEWSPVPPVRARLGKFEDFYSPQHLNKSPTFYSNIDVFYVTGDDKINVTPTEFKSPLTNCRTARSVRTRLYNPIDLENSFEANQSFPRVKRVKPAFKMELETPPKVKSTMDLVRVDGSNGLRFNSSLASLSVPGEPSSASLAQDRFPNRAVFTIEPNSLKILIVNNEACSLLGYSSTELCSMRFPDLLRDKRNDLSFYEHDGLERTAILLSGKVLELQSSAGATVVVSLWIRQLENDGPCLVVAEPVNYKQVVLTVNSESGQVLSCDSEAAAALFQAETLDKLIGLPVTTLIPSIVLPASDRSRVPKHIAKQKATGRSLDGATFPLCLWVSRQADTADAAHRSKMYRDKPLLDITIRVTYNVSGLLVIDESGLISACNHHFSTMTFGKKHSEVIGRPVSEIIQNFCRESDLVRPRQMTLSQVNNDDSTSDTDQDSCGAFNGSQKSACTSLNVQQSQMSQVTQEKSSSALCLDKSASAITHTPTPTQDMVSSLSTTEQRNDTSAIPDITSGMSGMSMEDEYCHTSISKSRSENILKSEQAKLPNMELDPMNSAYYTSEHSQEVTPTSNAPIVRVNDPSFRLSFDSARYRQNAKAKEDRNSISLEFCDSNETSADFLTPINEMPVSGSEMEDLPKSNFENESLSAEIDTQTEPYPRRIGDEAAIETPSLTRQNPRSQLTTSTPQFCKTSSKQDALKPCDSGNCPANCQHRDGTYRGVVFHKDGTQLNVVYTVSGMQLAAGSRVQCVWLGVTLSPARVRHTTLASSINSTDNSLAIGNKSVSSRPASMSLMSQCGEEQVAGDYSKHYATLKQIGKGAYGCVKMAYRRSDRLLVIAKFILKEKVGAHFWVDSADRSGKVPLEVSLLQTLQHPNIVTVLDVYENEKYFQMVMEKHGAGMDLFEFIERRPRLDEALISYIFRQIGQAVEYLHSLNILHRDIKDENVIIDNRFQVKLIDFGSATFMKPDTLFSTFYGTTEYCSPEVLAGNKYAGPELEMWSMGITLYVLTFFVNPFSDIEDTIQGQLMMPQTVSQDLEHLLRWMLCKEASKRCTVAQLMAHPWVRQAVNIAAYSLQDVVDCDRLEANPELYYSGSCSTPRSNTPSSLADAAIRERSEPAQRAEDKGSSKDENKRNSLALHALSQADRDAQSDNYSLRSSADILDISWKPASDAHTDISSDATGHAACDIDYDCEAYDCDSWDECEQDSFS